LAWEVQPDNASGKTSNIKEGHPTLSLCGRSEVTLQRFCDILLCLTDGAPKAESILQGIACQGLTS